jgi:hypothetical protein
MEFWWRGWRIFRRWWRRWWWLWWRHGIKGVYDFREWLEKEEFWKDFESILFNDERIKISAIEVEKIISILNLKEKDKIEQKKKI